MDSPAVKTFALAFNSLLSVACAKYINTGDRMLDNVIISFVSAAVGLTTLLLNNITLYNKFIYYFVDTGKDPWKVNHQLYKHPDNIRDWNAPWKEAVPGRNTAHPISFGTFTLDNSHMISPGNSAHEYVIYNHYGTLIYGRFVSGYDDMSFHCMCSKTLTLFMEILQKTHKAGNPTNSCVVTPQRILKRGEKEYVTVGKLSMGKTFDTLFYDQKEELVATLQKFKAGTMYPKGISMDNKLGILLYGPPGTGKTGTITAIANYLKRDILTINFAETTLCSQLDVMLSSEFHEKFIYIFDEFDCILNVLVGDKHVDASMGHGYDDSFKSDTDWTSMLALATEKEERAKILDMMRDGIKQRKQGNAGKIDLGYLLQKLDGIEDASGRIIIATTNHPENINPALLRPGRFDLKLCLGNCSAKMYEDILCAYYGPDARPLIRVAAIPPGKWSPLQVINTALTRRGIEETLKALLPDVV
jgi:hypothetical protein